MTSEPSSRGQRQGAMAAVGSRLPSPEGFHCQPWASLIEAAKPLSQDGFVLDEGSKEMSKSRDLSHVMRLRKEDMHIFGHCPSQDEFYLVGCSVCQQFIKPQALQAHYERRHGQSSRQSSAQIKYFPAASAALPSPRQSSDRDNEQEWERDGFPHHAAILNSVPGSQITLNSSAPSSLQCRPRVDSPTRVGGTTTQVVAQPNRLLRPARERPLDAGGGGVGGGGKQRNLTASSKTADKSCVPVVSLHKVDGAPSVRMSPTSAPASSCFKQSICPSSTSSSISSSSSLPISTVTGPRHIPPHSPACPPRCPTTSTKSAKSCSPVMPSIKPQPLTRSRPATTPATCFVTSRPNPCPPSSLRSNTAAAAASGTPNPPGSAPATFRLGSTGPSLSSRNSQMSGTGHSPSPKQNTTGTNASVNPPGSSCLTSSQEPTARSVAPSLKVAGNSHSASRLGVGGRLASGKGSGIKTSVSVQHGPNGPTGPGPIPNGKALVPGRRSHGDDGRLARKISHKRPVEREFDPDRHCGVLDPDTKRPCTRSLTCKTHSLSQRRAVPGRRTKFDLLLAEHKVRARHSERERDGEREREKEREKEKERGERLQQSPSLRDGERDGLCAVSTSNAPSTPLPSPESLSPIPVTGDAVLTSPAKHRATISRFHSMNLFPSRGGLVISPGNDVTHQPTAGDGLARPSSDEGEADAGEDGSLRDECCFSVRHPHPQAVCVFGARQFSPGVFAFSRSWDHLRSAFSTIVEQHLASQTWRKFPSTSILPTASPGRAQSTGSLHPAFLPCSSAITCSSISTVTTSSDTMLRPSLQSLSTPIPRPTASLPAPSLLSKPSKLKAGKQGSRPSLRETALSSGSSGPASGGGRKKKASVVGEGSRKNCASTSRALSSHAGLLGNSEPARHQELPSSRLARPADPLTSGHLDSHCPGRCSPTISPGRTAAFRRPEARKSRVVASSGTGTASGGGEVKSSKVAKGLDMDCVHARPSGGRTARGNNLFTGHQSKNRTSASPSRSSPGTSPSPLNRPGR